MLIQIVEDDRALSDGIRLSLREPGLAFIQSANIRQAKKTFEEEKPELIILDVNLPDGSGYEYLEWIRERSSLPILMLTANDMEMDEVKGLALGADDYMTKPFSIAVLRARVQVLSRLCMGRGICGSVKSGELRTEKEVDFSPPIKYNGITAGGDPVSKVAGAGKENGMEEEMGLGELLVEKAEENQTRKIFVLLNNCKDLEEAKEEVKALLNK